MRPAAKSCLLQVRRKSTESPDRNTHGEVQYSWIEDRKFWGKLTPTSGREMYVSAQREAMVTHRIFADYFDLDGVTAEMIVVFDPTGVYDGSASYRYFDIIAVLADHALRRETEIRVIEKAQAAVE